MLKKVLCTVLVLILCLTGTIHVYAAGVREPVIESKMPDCYIILGEHVLTLYTDASSPDGGTLEYQWYSTTINDIATIRAIDEETGRTFTPPQTVGVVYYCYAVWNIKSGLRSSPVYSRLIRVEYAEGEPTVESIEILSTPDKVVYTSGECLDLTGLKVRIWMSDGYIDSVNGDKLEITTSPLVTVGEQKIKVTYQGVSDFFIVTVEAPHTHSFGEWMIVTNPTCTETGIKEWECDCGHTERSEVAATGHQWDEGKVTKEATKNSDGVRTFTCTVCKKTRTEVVKAVAAISEPSDHVDTLETTQSESLPEKSESAGELQSSNTEQSSRLSWWIIAAIALILIVGVIVGTTILRKRKKVLLILTPKKALMLLPIRMKGVLGRKEWSNLKKRHTALFLAFVLLLTTLCTCGQQAKQTEQSESSSGKPTKGFVTRGAEKPSSEQSKEIAVTELYNEEGKGIFDDGVPYNYSFHVPQIEDDTADAAAINQEIASTYGEIAKVCLESIQNKEPPYCSSVEYESFRSGGVLTLVLKYAYFYDGFEGYATYIYDTAKGMRLSNRDILEMQDMTEAEYLSALRRAAAKDFDDAYHAGWGELEELHSSDYRELRRWTLSEQNLNLNLPFYLDDGVLHVIAPIGSIAGAGYLSRDLTLKAEEDADHVETAQLGDYLTVKRRGNTITLRVQQTPRLEALLGEYGLINVDAGLYDKDLTVNGLYGSYTKILCGEIGEADEPFLFLLTREGRVDYIDVLPCLRGGYFCGGGPLLGLANVKDLTHSSADGLPDICAVTQYGDQMGLWDIVSYQRYTMVDGLLNCDWSGGWFVGGTETSYSLTLMDGNSENFMLSSYVPNTDTVMNFSGNLTYLGMTEKGAVYAYWLWGEFSNGPGQTGVVALDQRSEFNGGDYESTLTVTELGGTPFLGNQTGDTTALAQSFG